MGIILLEFVKFNGKKCPPRQSDHLLVKLELMLNFFSSYYKSGAKLNLMMHVHFHAHIGLGYMTNV